MEMQRASAAKGSSAISSLGSVASIAAKGGLAAMALAALKLITNLPALTKESLGLQNAYKNLTFSIDEARERTHGFIEDSRLAILANQASALGVATTSKSFADLAANAQVLGARLGRDVNETLEAMIGAIGRGSTALLDNFGVSLREVQRLEKRLGDEIKRTGGVVDESQKKMLRQEAVMIAITMRSSITSS